MSFQQFYGLEGSQVHDSALAKYRSTSIAARTLTGDVVAVVVAALGASLAARLHHPPRCMWWRFALGPYRGSPT
jgi:hypothetical protein